LIRLIAGLATILILSISLAASEDCNKALALYNRGTLSADPVEKEKCFKKAIALCSDPELLSRIYNNLGDLHENQNRYSIALAYYRRAIELKKDLASPYFGAGDIFLKLNDYYSSYIMYTKGLKYKPEDRETLHNIEIAEKGFKNRMIIYFDFDSSQIPYQYHYRLELIASSFQADSRSNGKIKIDGHTCSTGSEGHNMKLSLKRARSIAEYLEKHFSIEPSRLVVTGKGEVEPLLPNTDKDARTLNRRAEIMICAEWVVRGDKIPRVTG